MIARGTAGCAGADAWERNRGGVPRPIDGRRWISGNGQLRERYGQLRFTVSAIGPDCDLH